MKQLITVDICKCMLCELFNSPWPSETIYRVAASVGQLLCCWQQQQWPVVFNTHSSRSHSGCCLVTEDKCPSSPVCTCHPNKGSCEGVWTQDPEGPEREAWHCCFHLLKAPLISLRQLLSPLSLPLSS